ncbi:MAG: FAD-dependent thymidylate synthase [Alphaproteobacteria bacterium]|nr:FAD-dependent thymidylate synthase [Alphaproteobacteria bacterium]
MAITQNQKEEIDHQKSIETPTRRATAPKLEEILYEAIPVLDHGFIRVIDYMGNDNAVVQAARVSYGKGTKAVREDQALISYLMRHHHSTPFEMCEIKYHVKLPIFVARQWIRHRTANVNEYSARYSILDNEFYIPNKENLAIQSSSNRQGRGDVLNDETAQEIQKLLREDANKAYEHYSYMLGNKDDIEQSGLARELARMNLSLNFYTQWYWKIDLHNLLHFLHLRSDPHAQYEIRAYAEQMLETVKRWVPITYEAFNQYRRYATTLSAKAQDVIKRMLKGESLNAENSGLGKREWNELMQKFDL